MIEVSKRWREKTVQINGDIYNSFLTYISNGDSVIIMRQKEGNKIINTRGELSFLLDSEGKRDTKTNVSFGFPKTT